MNSISGSTWTNELAWLVLTEGNFEAASKTPHFIRVPYIEYIPIATDVQTGIDIINNMDDPKIFKSHLSASYFLKQLRDDDAKFILNVRNPKDTMVSLYHFYKAAHDFGCFTGSWDEFFTLVEDGHLVYGDMSDYYVSWLPYLDHPKVLLLKYEDMVKDLNGSVRRVAKFLEKDLSEDVIQRITEHTTFNNMAANKMTNFTLLDGFINKDAGTFMRKGKVGQWSEYFSPEQNKFMDERYKIIEKGGLTLEFA